jgi:hypothetical protein
MKHRIAIALGCLAAAAGVLPDIASAHVGRTLPVATNFTARILRPVPGLRARVLDGDQTLWLAAPASLAVAVRGTLGEPLLRFDRAGVWLNLRSPTAQADGIDRLALRPSANPAAPPLWHRVSDGHTYTWHEHRLHLLEPLARGRSSAGPIGPWAVPIVAGARRFSLGGVLDYRPPGATWAWLVLTAALSTAASAAATRSAAVLVGLALAATALVWAMRIGRELYGRPLVGWAGYLGIAVTSLVGAALVYGLLHRDEGIRILTSFLVGFGALYEGLTMLPVLTHAIALNALPSPLARAVEALILVTGIGTLVGSVFGHLRAPLSRVGTDSSGAAG